MDVLFRKDKNTKEVVAFLPECPVNYGNILCYNITYLQVVLDIEYHLF